MNVLELRRGEQGVEVRIDGRDLRDIVRVVELPHAVANGQPDLAGSYEGIPPDDWVQPAACGKRHVAVLGCTCGVTECWPLLVRISVKAGTVVWSDFKGPMQKTVYEALGPFTFAREQYQTALAALAAPHY